MISRYLESFINYQEIIFNVFPYALSYLLKLINIPDNLLVLIVIFVHRVYFKVVIPTTSHFRVPKIVDIRA